MRIAAKDRKRERKLLDLEVGIPFKWVPGSSFPAESLKEKHNSEAKRIRLDKGLFADDTTILGRKKELEIGVRITKETMAKFEERNNDHKEEVLDFGEESSNNIRMLGCYMGIEEDNKQRKMNQSISTENITESCLNFHSLTLIVFGEGDGGGQIDHVYPCFIKYRFN